MDKFDKTMIFFNLAFMIIFGIALLVFLNKFMYLEMPPELRYGFLAVIVYLGFTYASSELNYYSIKKKIEER